jgi:hypothetical protein
MLIVCENIKLLNFSLVKPKGLFFMINIEPTLNTNNHIKLHREVTQRSTVKLLLQGHLTHTFPPEDNGHMKFEFNLHHEFTGMINDLRDPFETLLPELLI